MDSLFKKDEADASADAADPTTACADADASAYAAGATYCEMTGSLLNTLGIWDTGE